MIKRLINEINRSRLNGCYLVALMSALTLPDICGKAEFPNEKGEGKRYRDWCERYIDPFESRTVDENGLFCSNKDNGIPYISSLVVYKLRCSLLHEGAPGVDMKRCELTAFKIKRLTSTDDVCWAGTANDGKIRFLEVDFDHLIDILCRRACDYYNKNVDKFDFLNQVEFEF